MFRGDLHPAMLVINDWYAACHYLVTSAVLYFRMWRTNGKVPASHNFTSRNQLVLR
jgi:hypothetical protein